MRSSLASLKFSLPISNSIVIWHDYFLTGCSIFFFLFFLTETSIFSVEGVFLYPEGRPCAVKTWKITISTVYLLQLCRDEVPRPSDDRHRAPCLTGNVQHKECPLMLLENSSSGTIITILPPGGALCLFWSTLSTATRETCFCSRWNLSWHDSDVLVESCIYFRKGRVVEWGIGKPK